LPGKKVLLSGEQKPQVIAIDVTEHPIERPKKNRRSTIPALASNHKSNSVNWLGLPCIEKV
jgi:hypothetical protein